MTNQIVTQTEPKSNILTDGVHEYDHPEDKFVVIVDGDEVAWTPTEAAGWTAYNEITRIECKHVKRNPANGLGRWWIIRTADYTASISRDGKVSYEDA